jgi:NTE family protein
MTKYNTICLSGGGVSGILHISILQFLNKNNIIKFYKIKKYISTSVGTIISFLLIIGYKTEEIIDFINNFDFKYLNEDFDIDNIFINYGLNTASKIIVTIQTFLYNKTKKKDITFKELKNEFNKSLGIIGTNITLNREEYFSPETTPDMSVILAIRISISIPILFTPVKYNNNLYVDGGLFNNFPINYCNKKTTLGITLHNQYKNSIDNIYNYMESIFRTIIKSNNTKNNYNKNNVIICKGVNTYDLTNDIKKKLINDGIKIAEIFCQNKPEYIIYNIINKIIDQLN